MLSQLAFWLHVALPFSLSLSLSLFLSLSLAVLTLHVYSYIPKLLLWVLFVLFQRMKKFPSTFPRPVIRNPMMNIVIQKKKHVLPTIMKHCFVLKSYSCNVHQLAVVICDIAYRNALYPICSNCCVGGFKCNTNNPLYSQGSLYNVRAL